MQVLGGGDGGEAHIDPVQIGNDESGQQNRHAAHADPPEQAPIIDFFGAEWTGLTVHSDCPPPGF